MVVCLGYVQDGSTVTVPSATCCDELKQVMKASPSCLCEEFKMASDLGIKLNMTRALGLPQACSVQAPDVADCSGGMLLAKFFNFLLHKFNLLLLF